MPKLNKMYVGIIVFMLYLILPMIASNFLTPISESTNLDFIFRSVLDLIILFLFIYIYRNDLKEYWKNFVKEKGKNIKKIILYLLLSIVIMFCCSFLVSLVFPNIEYANDDIILEYFSSSMWFMVFSIILYTPIIEEIVFRKTFKDIINSKWIFVIFSALVFAFYHVGYNFVGISSILGMIPYFGLGAILGISYIKSNSLFVPIFVHILYDVFVVFINFA